MLWISSGNEADAYETLRYISIVHKQYQEQNDDKKNDSKNKRKALTGDIVFHDKSATCGYEVVSIVNKESIWMVSIVFEFYILLNNI